MQACTRRRRGTALHFATLLSLLLLLSHRSPTRISTAAADSTVAETVDTPLQNDALEGFQKPTRKSEWRLEDGVLTGSTGPGVLATRASYTHFELEFEAILNDRANRRGNSGVFFWSSGLQAFRNRWPDGPEVQLDHGDPNFWTGAVWKRAKARPTGTKDGEWFHMRVRAVRGLVSVWVNGEMATEYEYDGEVRSSPIAFQMHHPSNVVRFRDLRIQRLSPSSEAPWPQFRGPNAIGQPQRDQTLPDDLTTASSRRWRTALPPGHSSPVVAAGRVFVTAVRGSATDVQLVTLALDADSGEIEWERAAPHKELERVHRIGSYAQPSPASDGDRVVVLFGSSGLTCYSVNGTQLWSRPMGPFNDDFGAGASPLIVDDWVILNQDHDTGSFLSAIDKRTGRTVWRTDRSEFPRGYATPVVWGQGDRREIVVCGTLRVVGYGLHAGDEKWTVRGISRLANMTPAVGADGRLYVAAWAPGGDTTNRISAPPFDTVLGEFDSDGSGDLQPGELPADGPIGRRYRQIDRDKNERITRLEYDGMRAIFARARNVLLAIRPGGRGDITKSHVVWTHDRLLPYVPSPLVYEGHVYMIKNGGIFSAVEAETGSPIKHGRVSAGGDYYSSPVAGDGRIYLLNRDGELTIVRAGADWEELSSVELGAETFATPAIASGRIYVRTNAHLHCFGDS